MKRLISIATLLLCTASGYALAQADAEPLLPVDSRIKILTYDESDVYTIVTKYGYQTNIVFSPHEEIQTVSVGDRSLWQIIPSGNRMFIRPMEENVITNMTVLTNRHSYQFDLKSISDDKSGNIYVAKFRYPDEEPPPAAVYAPPAPMPAAAAPATPAFAPVPPAPPPAPGAVRPMTPNYNYTYSGADDIAPMQVYDDGRSTFLKYRDAGRPLPSVTVVGADGHETPVTTYVRDNLMVVDQVVPELALHGGTGTTVHVYNEMLNPGTTD